MVHEALLKDKQAVVRKAVCQPPNLEPEITKMIGNDDNEGVVEEIFKREDLTESDLEIQLLKLQYDFPLLLNKPLIKLQFA